MSRRDYKPAHLIDLNKKLTIKEIKYILNNLKWNRHEYEYVKELWNKYLGKQPEKIDYDLIESLQAIYKYSDDNVKLCKITNIFNKFVKVHQDITVYEGYLYEEDRTCSAGYELVMNIPNELRDKLIKYGQKLSQEKEEEYIKGLW